MDNERKITVFDELVDWFSEHNSADALASTTITREELIALGLDDIAEDERFDT